MTNDKPHSVDYFGAQRDFWWNADFFDLMAKRWDLANVRRVLDVGCGRGHWARQILPRCHETATLLGVDMEAASIEEARATAKLWAGDRASFHVGDAMDLAKYGSGFDLVTCQTVLIHLADPARAVSGMIARLTPRGLLAVAEPNNLANHMVTDNLDVDVPMSERLARLAFHWTCETGKKNLGLGDNSLGDRVPELFARAGLADIQVYNSDKVATLIPPYSSDEKRALCAEVFENEARDFAGWDRETAERYFLAGGGNSQGFQAAWPKERARVLAIAKALREDRYYANTASVFYLVSGRTSP
jgi:ubiquinone/menaquinone biosynthesis C-methylase UbiE